MGHRSSSRPSRSLCREKRGLDSLQGVYEWVRDVRAASNAYIAALGDEDWHRVPPTSEFDMTAAQ